MNIINKQLYKALKEYKRNNTLLNGILKDNKKEYRKDRKIYQERYEVLNQDLYEQKEKIDKAIEYIEDIIKRFNKINDKELISNRLVDIECIEKLFDILRGDE